MSVGYYKKNILRLREHYRIKSAEKRKNPEFVKKEKEYYQKWYRENGRNRAVDYQEAIVEWQINHREAINAQAKVHYAIKMGRMIKPNKCSECDRDTRLSGHHNDYSKPLEVLWLCSSCHKLKHTPEDKKLPRSS